MLQLLLNSYKRWCTWGKDKHITHELLIEQNLWLRQTTIWYFSFCHLKPGTLNWEFYYDYTSGCSEAPRTMAVTIPCSRVGALSKDFPQGDKSWESSLKSGILPLLSPTDFLHLFPHGRKWFSFTQLKGHRNFNELEGILVLIQLEANQIKFKNHTFHIQVILLFWKF